jgi:esterase
MRLNFQVEGDGPPLITIHGFLGALDNWRAMSKRLSAHYEVYSVDLRNHGRSPHSGVMNYSVMAHDLGEFLDEHGLVSASIIGHSLGGKAAMQFALEFPERVDKLVIVDIAPKAYPPTHRPLLTAMRNLDVRALASFAEADAALALAVTDAALRQFLIKNLARSDDGELRWRIALDSIIHNYDEITKAIVTTNIFEKPALFLRAGRSNFVEEKDIALIRRSFPHAEIRTITDAGHWLHIEAPDEFYRVVTEFLGIT